MDKEQEDFLRDDSNLMYGCYLRGKYVEIPLGFITLDYIAKLKEFEGLRLRAYKPAGEKATANYTIGYGHHSKTVKRGQRITEWDADYLLASDLSLFVSGLQRLFHEEGVPLLGAKKMCALVDFAFNLGFGALESSTLWMKIKDNPSDPTIPNEFRKWVYSGKRKLPGLVKRCEYRVELWNAVD